MALVYCCSLDGLIASIVLLICTTLWIKASAKWLNVNVNVTRRTRVNVCICMNLCVHIGSKLHKALRHILQSPGRSQMQWALSIPRLFISLTISTRPPRAVHITATENTCWDQWNGNDIEKTHFVMSVQLVFSYVNLCKSLFWINYINLTSITRNYFDYIFDQKTILSFCI